MVILLLFNNNDSLTVGEIRKATSIPDPDLQRHLLSLTTAKLPILLNLSPGKRFSDDIVIGYNPNFTCKLFRVKVPLLKEERDLQAAAVPADVVADRRMVYVFRAWDGNGHCCAMILCWGCGEAGH